MEYKTKTKRRFVVYKILVRTYDILVLPLRIVRLLLEWSKENISDNIVYHMEECVRKGEE